MQILYTAVGLALHDHGCDFIMLHSGPFQKAGRERGRIHTEVWKKSSEPVQNRSKVKVNQKSGRFTNVSFHSRMNRKGRSSLVPLSGPVEFLWVHASAFHLLSWLFSPSIFEKLSFVAGAFSCLETSF